MDTTAGLNDLKRHVFFSFMRLVGRVFILVRYTEDVLLGSREFTPEEIENGIVLVFNSKMNLQWDEYGITATLVFGTSPQKCFIPAGDIIAVYSAELSAQFVASPQAAKTFQNDTGQPAHLRRDQRAERPVEAFAGSRDEDEPGNPEKEGKPAPETFRNVIKVDFTRKKKSRQKTT